MLLIRYGAAYIEGLEVHHECGVRRCVNPEHLVPLTRAEHAAVHAEVPLEELMRLKLEELIRAA